MVYVIEEYHLNDEGREYFDDWIMETLRVIPNFEGYHTLQQVEDINQPGRKLLMKIFDTISNFHTWDNSHEHQEVLGKLRPYMTQDRDSTVYHA
jgi:antibiotic biosynthesis monooxygenase (ABM) superfamily enzyme